MIAIGILIGFAIGFLVKAASSKCKKCEDTCKKTNVPVGGGGTGGGENAL